MHEMRLKVNADVNIEISSEGLLKIPHRYTIIDWLSTMIKLEQHSKAENKTRGTYHHGDP